MSHHKVLLQHPWYQIYQGVTLFSYVTRVQGRKGVCLARSWCCLKVKLKKYCPGSSRQIVLHFNFCKMSIKLQIYNYVKYIILNSVLVIWMLIEAFLKVFSM